MAKQLTDLINWVNKTSPIITELQTNITELQTQTNLNEQKIEKIKKIIKKPQNPPPT